jgi:hypothetical protein
VAKRVAALLVRRSDNAEHLDAKHGHGRGPPLPA